ncbi:hypothetical protein DENSPDRAFT_931692 [Dentipellis sp. KUC8613]|nr:hypothetical protein DENSPDRAFT_931692 [Dentipellis sp. KUC8613]
MSRQYSLPLSQTSESASPQDNDSKVNDEDNDEIPTVDEHLQRAGAEAFEQFQRIISNLDRELRNFSNSARQLGGSVGILSSAFHLRERLTKISYLFRENAADLFPRKINRLPKDLLVDPNFRVASLRTRKRPQASTSNVSASASTGSGNGAPRSRGSSLSVLDVEDVPAQLWKFADDVMTFLHCFNEVAEFTDEAVNNALTSFDSDLRYWSSCLKEYEGQFRYPGVQRYLHDLTADIGDHLEAIRNALSMFVEIGVPTIRSAQKYSNNSLRNLSTLATFFSAVTATTLQFSFNLQGDPLSDSVNGFWFISLVFSVAAAVNGLLGLTWKQAIWRSPGDRVPWWVLAWIKRSPLVFLVLSVASFSVGLVLFTYSTNQHLAVCIVTTIMTAVSSLGLACVSAWFASERWIFNRHQGTKWLLDSIKELWNQVMSIYAISLLYSLAVNLLIILAIPINGITPRLRMVVHSAGHLLLKLAARVHGVMQCLSALTSRLFSHLSKSSQEPPSQAMSEYSSNTASPNQIMPILRQQGPGAFGNGNGVSETKIAMNSSTLALFDYSISPSLNGEDPPMSPARARFASAVRAIMMMRSGATFEPRPAMHVSRVVTLAEKLRGIEVTQDLAAHKGRIKRLQFSPNGKFLATSSSDRTSCIFHVGDTLVHHRILAHPSGVVRDVVWSPIGNKLLTRLPKAIKVWTEAGVCVKTIERPRVDSIAWFPGGEAFISVEGSTIVKLSLTGEVLGQYEFVHFTVDDAVVMPGGQWLFGIGTSTASRDGRRPTKCRSERRIFAYHMDHKLIQRPVPVFHQMRAVMAPRSGLSALVSFESQVPQLWRIDEIKPSPFSVTPSDQLARPVLRHSFLPPTPTDWAGPAYFGGKDDELVICASKPGDIYVWDTESAALLRHIPARGVGGDVTALAWNPTADPFMFATGTHSGSVGIWTLPPPSTPVAPVASRGATRVPSRTSLTASSVLSFERPTNPAFPPTPMFNIQHGTPVSDAATSGCEQTPQTEISTQTQTQTEDSSVPTTSDVGPDQGAPAILNPHLPTNVPVPPLLAVPMERSLSLPEEPVRRRTAPRRPMIFTIPQSERDLFSGASASASASSVHELLDDTS